MTHKKPKDPKPSKPVRPSKPQPLKPLQCPPHNMVNIGGRTWSCTRCPHSEVR